MRLLGGLVAIVLLVAPAATSAHSAISESSNVVTSVSAASYQGGAVAPGSIVSAFGTNLATATETATSTPLPQALAGTSVKVTDSAGVQRTASLFFVSPAQVNYLLPDQTAEGLAAVTVYTGQGSVQGSVLVKKAAPGLFSANADGRGVAAAYATRFTAQNAQVPSGVARYDAVQGKQVTAPLDMGAETDRVFLSLYGTGLRHAANVEATIAGERATVTFAGAHSVYAGLDQVNVEVPRSLVGRGVVTVQLTADGVAANPVTVEVLQFPFLNLDFEVEGLWKINQAAPAGFEFAYDGAVAYSGNRSLRIRNVGAQAPSFGDMTQWLPLEAVRGKHVRLSGYIKSENITRGYTAALPELTAYVMLRVDGPPAVRSASSAPVPGPWGTTDWRALVIEHDVSPDATGVLLDLLLTGDGTVWFDDLQLTIDGAPYQEAPGPLLNPSAGQLDWVRQNAIAFLTPDAGNGLDDLLPLKQLIGDAHVVGMGEATHGTSEFFRMKHRLFEFLATEMGFTTLAMEVDMAGAYKVNDYLLNGTGDPKELLKGMNYWMWNTQEVLDMILWMRQFNLSGKGPVQFTGFDMQSATAATQTVHAFVTRADPAYLGTLDGVYSQVADVSYMSSQAGQASRDYVEFVTTRTRGIWQYLDGHRSDYRAAGFSDTEVEWAIQNGKIAEQATYNKIADVGYRDSCMAANLEWIVKQAPPGAKIVSWAHNWHVSKSPNYYWGSMGYHLAQAHGDDYRVLGFASHDGRYNAWASTGAANAYDAVPSYPGSVEYVFHSTGMPQFILDLRLASNDDPASFWLLGSILNRNIGSYAIPGFSLTIRLTKDYDALIFFNHTTPSRLLPF